MTNKQIYFKLIYGLTLIFLLIHFNQGKQITLFKRKIQTPKQPIIEAYFLKLNIANLKVNLHASLNNKNTWLKSDKCQVCSLKQPLPENQQNSKENKEQDNKYQCSQTCFNNEQQYGVKCIKSHCTSISISKVQNQNFILSGQKVQLQVLSEEIQQKNQKLKLKSILVQRISKGLLQKNNHNQRYDGQYAIFGDGPLFENSFLVKGNSQQKVTSQIITIYDNEKDISNYVIENDKTVLQISSSTQIEETANNFQFMEFGISQIKIIDLPNINHEGVYTDPIQIPINPLSRGTISLDTQKLHLPPKHFHKFMQQIIKSYFSSSSSSTKSNTNICQFSQGSITCSQQISLQKIQYTEMQLVVNGVSLKFPLKILIQNCKKKQCQFLIAKSQHFIIGEFILNSFIISSKSKSKQKSQSNDLSLVFHRLDNQFGTLYKTNQKYNKQKFSIIWWIISTIYYLFYYFFKLVFYLAILSILINCCVHWRKVLKWIKKICDKIQKKYKSKNNQNSFYQQQEEKDTSKLIRDKKQTSTRGSLPSMEQQQSIRGT